jgi:hypothetical protein
MRRHRVRKARAGFVTGYGRRARAAVTGYGKAHARAVSGGAGDALSTLPGELNTTLPISERPQEGPRISMA